MTPHLPASGRPSINLGLMLYPGGGYLGAWRRPEAVPEAVDLGLWQRIARTAERGMLDTIFLADILAVWPFATEALARTGWATAWEPLTILSALAAGTEHIGLMATMTTTFSNPYTAARQFGSLDVISGGRAGWNVVTTASEKEAANFTDAGLPSHEARYERAQEFVDVVRGLWDSWDDGAFVYDKESGRYFDPAKMHGLDHSGKHFSVAGPLNVPRSPQGQPVLAQAGSSPTGRAFASRNAEVIFTAAGAIDSAREFYKSIKEQVAREGRDPDAVRIMPNFAPVIAETDELAAEKLELLQALLDPVAGAAQVQNFLGVDISAFDPDGPIPEVPLASNQGRQKYILDKARADGSTLRDLMKSFAGPGLLAGSAQTIADHIEEWVTSDAADGFMVAAPYLPEGVDEFVDGVVPELQRRGLFRTEYASRTLRGNLGLSVPTSRYAWTRA